MSNEYSNIFKVIGTSGMYIQICLKKILLVHMEGPDENQKPVDSVPLSPTVMLLKFDYIFSIRTMKTVCLILSYLIKLHFMIKENLI